MKKTFLIVHIENLTERKMNEENLKIAIEAYKRILGNISDIEESLDVSIAIPNHIWVNGEDFNTHSLAHEIVLKSVILKKDSEIVYKDIDLSKADPRKLDTAKSLFKEKKPEQYTPDSACNCATENSYLNEDELSVYDDSETSWIRIKVRFCPFCGKSVEKDTPDWPCM